MKTDQLNQPERKESLWTLAAAPLVWASHLLLSYCTAAIWCAKFADPDGSLGAVRIAIGVYTLVCLIGIALLAWRSWTRHSYEKTEWQHDFDSPEARHRFLGFMSLLLAGLAAVAVLYQALPAVFIGSCQ